MSTMDIKNLENPSPLAMFLRTKGFGYYCEDNPVEQSHEHLLQYDDYIIATCDPNGYCLTLEIKEGDIWYVKLYMDFDEYPIWKELVAEAKKLLSKYKNHKKCGLRKRKRTNSGEIRKKM